jgi:hypothetical protein
MALKRRTFNDITSIQANLGDGFADIPTTHIMKCWHDCWTHYVRPQEGYFQGDNIDLQVSVVTEK